MSITRVDSTHSWTVTKHTDSVTQPPLCRAIDISVNSVTHLTKNQQSRGVMDKTNVVSNESIGNQGLYTEEERLAKEEARLNKHGQGKFNDPKPVPAAKQANLNSQGDFIFRVIDLPGPIKLTYEEDGSVIFSKDSDVANESFPVPLKGYNKSTLKVVLDLPTMNFKTTLSYPLKEGLFVTLEGTDEGLKNSQVSI